MVFQQFHKIPVAWLQKRYGGNMCSYLLKIYGTKCSIVQAFKLSWLLESPMPLHGMGLLPIHLSSLSLTMR